MTKGSCQSTQESKVQKCVKPASSARFASSTTSIAGGFVWATRPKSITNQPLKKWSSQASVQSATQELARSRSTDVVTVIDDHLTARENGLHLARDRHAFIGRVVDIHVMALGRQRLGSLRVIEHEVGVRARRD